MSDSLGSAVSGSLSGSVNASLSRAGQDLELKSPWLNAAGSLGFRPPRSWSWPEPQGAFVTNPISLKSRSPAAERGIQTFSGGFLLHTGLPNPGLRAVLKDYVRRWQHSSLPVWAHLLADEPTEVARMVQLLEGRDEISAIELGIPPNADPAASLALVTAAVGELPLVVAVPLDQAAAPWLKELPSTGASAISLTAPRGSLPALQKDPTGAQPFNGRMFGPALFPLLLAALQSALQIGLPVIAGGGVYRLAEGRALLSAGAWAVQLDVVLWRGAL